MTTDRVFNALAIAVGALLCVGIVIIWAPPEWSIGLFRLVAYSISLLAALAIASSDLPVRSNPALFVLSGLAAWPLVQLGANTTIYRWQTIDSFWMWSTNFVLFFLTLQFSSPGRTRIFLQGFLYFAAILSVVSTLQMFTSDGKIFWLFPSGYTNYVLGPFVNRNQYAAFIELALPIALCFALFARKDRWIFSVIAALMVASVAASASRAGAVLVTLETIAVPLLAVRMGLISRASAASTVMKTLAFTAISGAIVGFGVLWDRLLSPDPYFLRRELLTSALRMFADRPWMGFGLGTWTVAYPAYAVFDPGAVINQAHNDWLQWAVEGGLPFAGLMLIFALVLIRPAIKSLWGLGVLVVLLHCLVDYPLHQRPGFAALFFALCGAVSEQSRTGDRSPVHTRAIDLKNLVHPDPAPQRSLAETNGPVVTARRSG